MSTSDKNNILFRDSSSSSPHVICKTIPILSASTFGAGPKSSWFFSLMLSRFLVLPGWLDWLKSSRILIFIAPSSVQMYTRKTRKISSWDRLSKRHHSFSPVTLLPEKDLERGLKLSCLILEGLFQFLGIHISPLQYFFFFFFQCQTEFLLASVI